MNVSKENAAEAREKFLEIIESSPSLHKVFGRHVQFLSEFFKAAERKLPSEAAYAREALRREKPKAKK